MPVSAETVSKTFVMKKSFVAIDSNASKAIQKIRNRKDVLDKIKNDVEVVEDEPKKKNPPLEVQNDDVVRIIGSIQGKNNLRKDVLAFIKSTGSNNVKLGNYIVKISTRPSTSINLTELSHVKGVDSRIMRRVRRYLQTKQYTSMNIRKQKTKEESTDAEQSQTQAP
jgi:hypothetical protein